MNDAQLVSCVLVPELARWSPLVPGNGNVLFALSGDNQLLRYDFPQ
jgi:hypothetical protein